MMILHLLWKCSFESTSRNHKVAMLIAFCVRVCDTLSFVGKLQTHSGNVGVGVSLRVPDPGDDRVLRCV